MEFSEQLKQDEMVRMTIELPKGILAWPDVVKDQMEIVAMASPSTSFCAYSGLTLGITKLDTRFSRMIQNYRRWPKIPDRG